jgi:hypothetical protein
VWQRVIGEVHELEVGVGSLFGVLHHPLGDGFTPSPWASASENDGNPSHGWTCEPAPRSRRIDCMIMNVVL